MSFLIDTIWNKIMIIRKQVKIQNPAYVRGRIYFHGKKASIEIGKNLRIISESSVNPTSGFNHVHLYTAKEGRIIIGDNVGISHANIVSYKEIVIENNVMIGSGVKIWDTDFHSLNYELRIAQPEQGIVSKPIRIKEGAFIGACSIILKGVTIGKHSIIGAGSVVTKNVPDNEIWAGNPAKCIRKL